MKYLIWFLFALLPQLLLSQQVHYEFSAPNAVHHEAEIAVTVKGIPSGPVYFRMSRSSPGRYATHEFGKNVYNVRAADSNGKTLKVEKTDAEVYKVVQHPGTVVLKYTLYGNYADGTYTSIDATGYHLNMPAAFMWVKGLEKAPITLQFTLLNKEWKIATQLKPTADPYTFSAPNLQYFMDAPTKVGNLHIREWKQVNPDKKQYTIRLALEAKAHDTLVNSFAKRLQRIVNETQAVYGELPDFDYGDYTFIASLSPYVYGDGMEHRNSTMITRGSEFTGANSFLNTFAHEFFHAWNVERIRPKSLEPFNFEKSNMSEALWIAEGFTRYYTPLLMRRAGLITDDVFFSYMSELINAKENTPGGMYYTPIENSQRAVFVDAGVSVDQNNYSNMFISYYSHGGALALALDLQLRKQPGKSLDGFMQQLWKVFGKPEKPYTLPEVQQVLAAYTTPAFASAFFSNNVYGHAPINYNSLLQAAGVDLKKALINNAWIGDVTFANDTTRLIVAGNTIRNTPLYKAGVDKNDEIVQIGDKKMRLAKDLTAVLADHKPGETLTLFYKHRSEMIETKIILEGNPGLSIVPMETTGTVTPTQKAFRSEWINAKTQL